MVVIGESSVVDPKGFAGCCGRNWVGYFLCGPRYGLNMVFANGEAVMSIVGL